MIDAGLGVNEVFGQAGNDIILAAGGDDKIVGGTGDDILAGGEGFDEFVFNTNDEKKKNLDRYLRTTIIQETIKRFSEVCVTSGARSLINSLTPSLNYAISAAAYSLASPQRYPENSLDFRRHLNLTQSVKNKFYPAFVTPRCHRTSDIIFCLYKLLNLRCSHMGSKRGPTDYKTVTSTMPNILTKFILLKLFQVN